MSTFEAPGPGRFYMLRLLTKAVIVEHHQHDATIVSVTVCTWGKY